MDIPIKKLLRLVEIDQPTRLRLAAIQVLGEVGGKDGELADVLLRSLHDEDPALRVEAIRAVGKLRIDKALPELATRIPKGGEEAAQAALAIAGMGTRGVKALQELMHEVAPGVRRLIAAALAGPDQGRADSTRLHVL